MRITGGSLCGRRIGVPRNGLVRPTQDRVREALFSVLGDRTQGSRFLDLFAGSGAVGLEALSRNAASVWWVETNRRALSVLRENLRQLCGPGSSSSDALPEQTRICNENVIRFLEKGNGNEQFDIIFADPPYGSVSSPTGERKDRKNRAIGADWCERILNALDKGRMPARDALFIMEQAKDEELTEHSGWTLMDDRPYGDARLRFFQRD